MKIFAEIMSVPSLADVDRADSYPVRLSVERGMLTVEAFKDGAGPVAIVVGLEDLRDALLVIAPDLPKRVVSHPTEGTPAQLAVIPPTEFRSQHELRATMRARKAEGVPEANVVTQSERVKTSEQIAEAHRAALRSIDTATPPADSSDFVKVAKGVVGALSLLEPDPAA